MRYVTPGIPYRWFLAVSVCRVWARRMLLDVLARRRTIIEQAPRVLETTDLTSFDGVKRRVDSGQLH